MALSKVGGNQIDTAATPTVAEATITGDLTVDTNTLKVNSTNNRVSIGGTSPSQKFVVTNAGADNIVMCENSSASIQMFMQAGGSGGTVGTLTNHQLQLLTNNTARMTIDGSGRVTMPNQPMFTVNGVAAVSTTPGNSQVLNFSGVYVNVGGHFNISTDRFVAPVTGHYFFAFSCMTTTQTHTSNIVIRKNGGGRHSSYTQNATYLRHNIAVVEQLAANDYVDIVLEHGGVHAGFDHFSGFLIG